VRHPFNQHKTRPGVKKTFSLTDTLADFAERIQMMFGSFTAKLSSFSLSATRMLGYTAKPKTIPRK
jgi:hypothetical protein